MAQNLKVLRDDPDGKSVLRIADGLVFLPTGALEEYRR